MSFYKGEFKADHPHGQGEQRTIGGDLYEGSFVRGKKGPKGKWTFADKTVYEGAIENDSAHGFGKLFNAA